MFCSSGYKDELWDKVQGTTGITPLVFGEPCSKQHNIDKEESGETSGTLNVL